MKTQDAIRFFGSQETLLAALNLKSRRTIWAWQEFPPYSRQYQIKVLTNGVLRAERPVEQKAAERPVEQKVAEHPLIKKITKNTLTLKRLERRHISSIPANHDIYSGVERRFILVPSGNCERPLA